MMNDAGQAIVALGICATVAITVTTIARAYIRRVEAERQPQRDLAPDAHDRMSRIEQAVDAIAIEVERMSEGQRFTTRLLAERLGDRASGLDGESVAPPVTRRQNRGDANGAGGHHER